LSSVFAVGLTRGRIGADTPDTRVPQPSRRRTDSVSQ
jgi:hypothetical protein